MSWTDNKAIKVIKFLRDKFKIDLFIETGTFKGINAELHSKNFKKVYTIERLEEFWEESKKRLDKYDNVITLLGDSSDWLRMFCQGREIYYLDAHFYDPKLPKKKRFVVLDELKALKGNKDCIIIIHDFDNNLGHITYDGISLDLDLIRKDLFNVNPKFHLYTNTLEGCDIRKPKWWQDKQTKDNLKYAHKTPRLTYRGILYCLPKKLTKKEMNNLGLRKWS